MRPTEEELTAEDLAAENAAPHVNFYDPSLFADLEAEVKRGEGAAGKLTAFMTLLALCHTVIPERPDNDKEVILSVVYVWNHVEYRERSKCLFSTAYW